MTELEASMIIKDLENINKRLDRFDDRLEKFIKDAAQMQAMQAEIKAMKDDQTRNRESLDRAFKEIEKINHLLVNPEKINQAIKDIVDLKSEPMKKDAATVGMVKNWIKTGVGAVIITGVTAFITWLIISFSKGVK